MQTQTNKHSIFRLLFCLIMTSNLNAQTTLYQSNQKLFGGSGGEIIYAIKPTADNGLIYAGVVNSWLGDGDVNDLVRQQNGRAPSVDGHNDAWIVKLASDYKTIQWQRVIGGSQLDEPQSIVQMPDGNYLVAGFTYTPNDGDITGHHACDANNAICRDGWVMKIRGTDGAILWSKCYGGSGDDNFYDIQPMNDGSYLIAGYTTSLDGDINPTGFHDAPNNNNDGYGDGWIVKIDTSGKILSQKTIGGTLKDIFRSMSKTSDGGFILSGYTNSSDFDLQNVKSGYAREAWLLRLDATATNILWQNVVSYPTGNNFDSRSYNVKQTKKGEYVMCGTTSQIPYKQDAGGNIQMDVFVAKFSTAGALKWKKSFGGSNDDWGQTILSLDADDGVVVAGYTNSPDGDVTNYHGLYDGWVIKCDSLGNKVAASTMGGNDYDNILTSTIDNFGKIILAGASQSTDLVTTGVAHGNFDCWLFQLNFSGSCANIGTACNDNNANTINDVIQPDCTCAGTVSTLTVSNCPQPITVTVATNATTGVASWTAPTATTNCTNGLVKITQTAGLTSGSAFPIGAQTVTYTVKDSCLNTKTCSFVVTINTTTVTYNCPTIQKNFGDACNDNNANTINDVVQTDCTCKGTPTLINVLTCPASQTITAATGATTAVATWSTPTATTTCTNGLIKTTQSTGAASGSAFPVGVATIAYSLRDSCLNLGLCSFTITVKAAGAFDCPTLQKNIGDACDDGNPNTVNDKIIAGCTCAGTPKQTGSLTITCPTNITVNAATGATTAVATWNDPSVSTTCPNTGGGTSTCTAGTFAGFTSLGKFGTSNYYLSTASNQWDNANTICQSNGGHLVVISSQAENDFVSSKIGAGNAVFIGLSDKNGVGTYVWADGTTNAYTNWDGGTPNNNGASLGNYTAMLSWAAGRWSNQNKYVAKQFVMEVECGGNGIALAQTTGLAKGSAFPVGTQTVTYQAADSCGNVQTCSFTVTVSKTFDCIALQKNIGDACDDGNPNTTGDKIQSDCSCKGTLVASTLTLTCPASQTITAATGATSAIATWALPTATTTCAGNLIKITQTAGLTSGSAFPIGTQAITYTAVDSCASAKACSFTITVNNGSVSTSTLVLNCPAPATVTAASGATTAIVSWSTPTATTTCANGLIKISQTDSTFKSGSAFPVGIKTITLIAKDSCNSVKSCSFPVTVNASGVSGPDIALSFTNTQTTYAVFNTFHYLLSAKNMGNSAMTNVVIQFKFPAGTVNGGSQIASLGTYQTFCAGGVQCYQWTIPNLPLGATATLDAPVFILLNTSAIVAGAKLLSATPTDVNPANDSATLILAVPLHLNAVTAKQTIPIVVEKLYPNPVSEELDIKLNSLIEKDVRFNFFNSLGTTINNEQRHVEIGENIFRFDVSTWQNGVYYVLPDVGEGINPPIKFIKLE